MRNPDRLDVFYSNLCAIHKKYFPDWRFGQLMSNFLGWVSIKRDPFFPEEDEMLAYLNDYVKAMIAPQVTEYKSGESNKQ